MNTWDDFISKEVQQPYFKQLTDTIEAETGTIYPPKNCTLRAFQLTPLNKVKCVILGQDPYHEPNQAMGLSFSVPEGTLLPPSLKNIYKELQMEYGGNIPMSGDLTHWAMQGVLLLNTVLTVREHKPNSHKDIGWERFTDNVILTLENENRPIVYMLWGNYAKQKQILVRNPNHLILTSAHPSPFSCKNFFGNNHFKQCNQFLLEHHVKGIEWVNYPRPKGRELA